MERSSNNTDQATMTETTNSHDDDDDDTSSPTERCAFVLHVTVAIFAVVYTAWVLLAMVGGTSGGRIAPSLPPPPSWLTHTFPTVAVGLFFAAPILYAVQNSTIVAPAHSIASLQDSVTAKQRRQNVRQPAQNDSSSNNAARQGLPEIVDLDVGEINDLCWKAMQTSSW